MFDPERADADVAVGIPSTVSLVVGLKVDEQVWVATVISKNRNIKGRYRGEVFRTSAGAAARWRSATRGLRTATTPLSALPEVVAVAGVTRV